MTNTDDLRTALRQKANAAPTFDADALLRAVDADAPSGSRSGPRLAPAAAAIAVAAVAATSIVLTQRATSTGPAAASTGAAPSSSAATTPAPGPGPTTQPTPTFIHISSPDLISNVDLRPNVQIVTTRAGTTHTEVSAYATGVFDPARITGAVAVEVDGLPGLFGSVSVWPVNGRPDPATGKQDVAAPSLAWQVGAHWIVLQIDDPNHPTEAQLLDAAARVTITAAS